MNAYRYIILVLASIAMLSCSDIDLSEQNGLWAGDGKTTLVTLNVSVPEIDVQTKALTVEQEESINDLYVIVFNAATKKCTYRKYFTAAELSNANAQANHSNAKLLTLGTADGNDENDVPTGDSYIFAIANIITSQMDGTPFRDALDAVVGFDDFDACVAALKEKGNVDRVQSLSMSGWYHASNSTADCKEQEIVTIQVPSDGNALALDGYIHLRRFDSKITFTFKPSTATSTNSEGEQITITGFKMVDWTVYNVPDACHVFEKETNASGITYSTSAPSINFNNETAGQSSFSFYLLENLNSTDGLTDYDQRELEAKNPDGTNAGTYVYAPENSSYVVVNVELTMHVEQADGTVIERRAYPQYTIHLGYCKEVNGNKANDFNCNRNTQYTYNVTINDVDSIVMEAQSGNLSENTPSTENQPGQEGEVYDPEIYIDLDAHYAVFNIELPLIDEGGKFTFMVDTPFNRYDQDDITGSAQGLAAYGEDFTWIQFIEAPDQNNVTKLASYPGTDSDELLDLYELGTALKTGSGTKWYTVFVNEYIYDSKDWTTYVNQDARMLMLHVTPHVSTDKESEYYELGYLVSQKSIQTYYNTSSPAALGLEHMDETHGKNLNWSSTYGTIGAGGTSSTSYQNKYNGLLNVQNALVGKNWSTYADVTAKDSQYYTFNLKTADTRTYYNGYEVAAQSDGFYEILSTCLNRNRDLDGDDIIDENEIRWYVPGINQYIEMYLGGLSLVTPLFDASSIEDLKTNAPYNATYNYGNSGVNACRNDYHFASSDGNKLFAEQGCSINHVQWSNGAGAGVKWAQNVRCVRNLGTGTPQAYTVNDNIITMAYYDSKSVRASMITPVPGSFMPSHNNFDYTLNSPYYQFEYARNEISVGNYVNPYNSFQHYVSVVDAGQVCSEYSQDADGSDKGTWRIPNQREQVLFSLTAGGNTASCSYWKYDNRVCCFSGGVSNLTGTGNCGVAAFRCVRDVQTTSNYDAGLQNGGTVSGL